MNWVNTLGLALALSMDAFAVSIASGLTLPTVTPRHVFRLAFHFGLFQFLMPVIGWLVGKEVALRIGTIDHWIAFTLLTGVGGKMLWEARSEKSPEARPDPTRGLLLVTLSLATSLDALAVGLSLAFLRVSIWIPSLIIGVVTGTLSCVGVRFGTRFGPRWGRWAGVVGGGVLILIGLRIVIADLTAIGVPS